MAGQSAQTAIHGCPCGTTRAAAESRAPRSPGAWGRKSQESPSQNSISESASGGVNQMIASRPAATHRGQNSRRHDPIQPQRMAVTHLGREPGLHHPQSRRLKQNREWWSHRISTGECSRLGGARESVMGNRGGESASDAPSAGGTPVR